LAERYRGRGIGGLITAPTLAADPVPQNDLLNAELWMQTAIEYRANCLMVYALAKVRLDEALADRNWTAYDQSGSYQNLSPAVIIDLDETAIDNSAYEAGLVVNDTRFNPKTWDDWTKAEQAKAVPGSVEFANYAATKGVKVFYVSNRNADQKEATRHNLEALGFPWAGTSTPCLCKRRGPSGPRAPRVHVSPISRKTTACC